MEFERHILKTAEEVATTFRAMAVCGPRQVGKTIKERFLRFVNNYPDHNASAPLRLCASKISVETGKEVAV